MINGQITHFIPSDFTSTPPFQLRHLYTWKFCAILCLLWKTRLYSRIFKIFRSFSLGYIRCFTWLLVFFRYKLGTHCDVSNEVVSSSNVPDCGESKWNLDTWSGKKIYLAEIAQTSTASVNVHSTLKVSS